MDAAVKALGPIVEEILAADPPLVRQVRASGMQCDLAEFGVQQIGCGHALNRGIIEAGGHCGSRDYLEEALAAYRMALAGKPGEPLPLIHS